jgi:outer membrane protein assembly factor BamE (lipoprotein component of BamABCDE complex)
MKKSQILMSLLLVILLSSCYASRITYENLSIIQRGMSSKEVIAIMGNELSKF